MDLSVVIVNWNVRSLLQVCLRSVRASLVSSPLSWELCVVDNASGDGSPEMVRESFSRVRLIANAENLGYAGASNQGLESSTGRYCLILNPDTEVHGAALETMVTFLEATPRAGMVGPRLIFSEGGFQHSAFAFPGVLQVLFDLFPVPGPILESRLNGRYPRSRYASGRPFLVGHPLGACMMVRRTALDRVGGMDTGYFMYCEELDWAKRFHRGGWQVYCVPSAEVVHHAGQSTKQVRPEMYVQLWRSRLRFYRKHYGAAHNALIPLLLRAGLHYQEGQALQEARCGRLSAAELAERQQMYRGVRELIRQS